MFVDRLRVACFVLLAEGPLIWLRQSTWSADGLRFRFLLIMGLPAVLAALWIAIRVSRTPFATISRCAEPRDPMF